jgi:hypothetical protein
MGFPIAELRNSVTAGWMSESESPQTERKRGRRTPPEASSVRPEESDAERQASESDLKSYPTSEEDNHFLLEDLYPSASDLFSSSCIQDVSSGNSLVVLDTNTLLVPYGIKPDDLTALQAVYRALANADRLFIPARVAREFIKHRDGHLADLLKALNDQRSRMQIPEKRISPLLEGVPGYTELAAGHEALTEARAEYNRNLSLMMEKVRSWRGDDPVTLLYRSVFTSENVVELTDERRVLSDQWANRLKNKVPPGYKDSGKSDRGIGDFLIWSVLLKLGEEKGRDLIFVTGDEKADWFVRSNNEGIYPRPELVDEYRRRSGGRSLALLSLSGFLKEMQAGANLVDEVRSAEASVVTDDEDDEIPPIDEGKLDGLRQLLAAVFPERKISPQQSLRELYHELITSGNSDMQHVERMMSAYAPIAITDEEKLHHGKFYTDVGIARAAMDHAHPSFSEIRARRLRRSYNRS